MSDVLFKSCPEFPPVAGMLVMEARDERGVPWYGGPKGPYRVSGTESVLPDVEGSGYVMSDGIGFRGGEGAITEIRRWNRGQLDILSPLPRSMMPADPNAWARLLRIIELPIASFNPRPGQVYFTEAEDWDGAWQVGEVRRVTIGPGPRTCRECGCAVHPAPKEFAEDCVGESLYMRGGKIVFPIGGAETARSVLLFDAAP